MTKAWRCSASAETAPGLTLVGRRGAHAQNCTGGRLPHRQPAPPSPGRRPGLTATAGPRLPTRLAWPRASGSLVPLMLLAALPSADARLQ